MKILILILALTATSFITVQAQAGNCDTHSSEKKVKGSGI